MNEWREILASRQRTSKKKRLYIDDQPTNQYSLDSMVGTSLHYEEVEDSGTWLEVDPRIVPSAEPGWDWEMVKSHWRFLVRNGGWFAAEKRGVGIGFRLERVAYLNIVTKAWQTIRTANYGTPTITDVPTDNDLLPNSGGKLTWLDLFPGVDFDIYTGGDRLREQVVVSAAARAAMPALPYPAADTYLVMVYEVDWGRVPGLADDSGDIDPDTDFGRDGKLYLKDNLGAITAALPASEAWAESDREAQVALRKRFVHVGSDHYLLIGAPVLALNALPAGAIVFDPTVDPVVAASLDDTLVLGTNTNEETANYCQLGNRDGGEEQEFGLRFAVPIAQGTAVDIAYISVWPFQANEDSPEGILYCEDVDDADDFHDDNARVTDRDRTAASVAWDDDDIGINAWKNSPSLVGPIDEVLARGGWSSGNDLAILGIDPNPFASTKNLRFYQWDFDDNSKAAKLHIEYTAASGGVKDTMLLGLL